MKKDELSPIELSLINTIMANPNLSKKDIFRTLNISRFAGSKLLEKPNVQQELKIRQESARYDSMISCKRIMEEEACIAFADPNEMFEDGKPIPPHLLPERVRRALTIEVRVLKNKAGEYEATEYKYTQLSKDKAVERISRHLGLYEKDNAQKALAIYFVRADDENIPAAEVVPEIVVNKINPENIMKKAIALLE